MSLKKITLLIVCTCVLVGGVTAYNINLSVPKVINAGEVITVNGSSNLPPGFSTLIRLSRVGAFGVIAEKQITIQEGGSFTLTLTSDTLEAGKYKLELEEKSEFPYGSSSRTWIFFDLIDRRSDLTLTAPLTQNFDGTFIVSGRIPTISNTGLKIQIDHLDKLVIGPEYIKTSPDGSFEREVMINESGPYTAKLTDISGYTWIVQYNIVRSVQTTPPTTVTTTAPGATSATMPASRNEPAFFRVTSGHGVMRAYTSEGVDWVMEYIDETGVKKKINVRGTSAEEVTLAVSGGTIYFKIYPDRYDDHATVTLSAENARTIEPCTTCAGLFEAEATPTEATPLPLFLAIFAMIFIIALRKLQ